MQTQLDEDQKELERLTGIKNNLKSLMLESEQKAKVVLEQIEVCKVVILELFPFLFPTRKKLCKISIDYWIIYANAYVFV